MALDSLGPSGTFTSLEINFKSTSFVGDGFAFKSLSLGIEFAKITPTTATFFKSQTDIVVFGGTLPTTPTFSGLSSLITGSSQPVFGSIVSYNSAFLQIGGSPLSLPT